MATQDAVRYVGGPNGGTTVLADPAELAPVVHLHGGRYCLTDLAYHWNADAERADRTPRDGDEASALLAEHGGATPVIEQETTSSTTIASTAPVEVPKPQTKVATGSAARRAAAKG